MKEALKIPKEVVNANWKDDVPDLDYETYGSEKEEMDYVGPNDIPKESIEKIKSINLTQRFRESGRKINDLIKEEKIAA